MTAQLKAAADQQAAGPFVINLCASTTPMALAQPTAPELKRFSFFVSRRREDGRERFRLHMGYFLTFAEAEEWLTVVRDIYPGAWAGEAPGKKLAERAAAAAAPKLLPAEVAPTLVAKQMTRSTPVTSTTIVPTVHAAHAASHSTTSSPAPRSTTAPAKVIVSPKAAPAIKPSPVLSNVREVLKSLDDATPVQTRVMPPRATRPIKPPAQPAASLSDSQVLKILDSRRQGDQPSGQGDNDDAIALLRPDDTATVRALKEAVRDNAPVSFAVQLQWSVQPIDIAKMPPLAIFSAYTLYTVEGSRDGRKWYGLRLGFFGDAISAKQVAGYVRSEFTSVAVLPVSSQERSRATDGQGKASSGSTSQARRAPEQQGEEFKLIDDKADDAGQSLAAAQAQASMKKAAAPVRRLSLGSAARKSNKKAVARVRASEKRPPKTLEETLEILGASELEIDDGRRELLNDSGVRHLRVEVQKNSPFSRLLERLSERTKRA
jgi:hypothetical protein